MLRYILQNAFTKQYLGDLPLNEGESFSASLRSSGQLSGAVNIPSRGLGDWYRARLVPDRTEVIALWENEPIWGGLLTDFGAWDPRAKTLPLVVTEWRAWFDTRLITPNPLTNAPRDALFTWTGVDQLSIAASLVSYATSEQDCPPFVSSYVPSGRVRDHSVPSTEFKSVLEAIDALAHRQDGFDWSIAYRRRADQNIEAVVEFYYPERLTAAQNGVFVEYTTRGGNALYYTAPESSTDRVSRMWGTGEGTPPDQLVQNAADPFLGDQKRVYREAKRAYSSSIITPSVLNGHSRRELSERADIRALMTVDVYLSSPDVRTYRPGDRCRLVIDDEWLRIDLNAARILERTITGLTASDPPRATLTIDVSDSYGAMVEVE